MSSTFRLNRLIGKIPILRKLFYKVPILHEGKQGKHILTHNNFLQGNSILTHPNPQELLNKFTGTGTMLTSRRNQEAVDFGTTIGVYINKNDVSLTTRGIIHYSKDGKAHIVPAKPIK